MSFIILHKIFRILSEQRFRILYRAAVLIIICNVDFVYIVDFAHRQPPVDMMTVLVLSEQQVSTTAPAFPFVAIKCVFTVQEVFKVID